MYTEAEAKDNWCPWARVSVAEKLRVGDHAANRHVGDGVNPTIPFVAGCIASQCMAWRWASRTKGYCGNAGPP